MALLLGLAAACTYGAADFVGGLATRRAGALPTVVWSQLAGLLVLLLVLPVLSAGGPTAAALGWGAVAGLAGGTGVTLLYRALSIGRMSVVAPITAVEAASLPVLFGLVIGERPSAAALLGVVIALVAVALVSAAPEPVVAAPGVTPPPPATTGPASNGLLARPGLPEALGAGLAFGLFFIVLGQAGGEDSLWPLVGTRIGSLTLVLVLAGVLGRRLAAPVDAWRGIALAGVLDMLANVCYLVATRYGLLSLVAVLTSLYPAATVVLARTVLGERVTAQQLAGLGLAVVGVVLIGLG